MAQSTTTHPDHTEDTTTEYLLMDAEEQMQEAILPVQTALAEWADTMIDMIVIARAYQLATIAAEHDFSGIDEILSRTEREENGYTVYIRGNEDNEWTRHDHLSHEEIQASSGPIHKQQLHELQQHFKFIEGSSDNFSSGEDQQRLSLQAELGQRHLNKVIERADLVAGH